MFRTLLNKQFAELFRNFFYDAKKGKNRTRKQAIVQIVLYFVVFYIILGAGVFGSMAFGLAISLVAEGHCWLYFLIMMTVAVLMGVLGSVLSTYSSLYLSTDNELLLSMPIPVRYILASRLAIVYLSGLVFSATVMIPTLIVYYIVAHVDVLGIICPIIMAFNCSVFIFILSVALGWVVARISMRIKRKSLVATLMALLFLVAYYYFYIKAMSNIQAILENLNSMASAIQTGLMGVLHFIGTGAEGNILNAVAVSAANLLTLIAVYIIMDRSFIKIVTTRKGFSKIRYKEKTVRERSAQKALVLKEAGRLTSSSGYMLNSALGTFVMPVTAIALAIKGEAVRSALEGVFAGIPGQIAILLAGSVTMILSMNAISAPSVSLEGKNLWISKTLPVTSIQVIRAKMWNHIMFTLPAAMVLTITACIVLSLGVLDSVLVAALVTATCFSHAEIGLYVNLRKPNLNWTNETVVVKSSLGLVAVIFGSWILAVLEIVSALLLPRFVAARILLAIWVILIAFIAVLLDRWIRKRGTRLFESL